MYLITNRWILAIILYIGLITIIVYTKPAMMFDAEKKAKVWGIGNDETEGMFSPMIVFPIIAILSYYSIALIECMTDRT